MIATVTVNIFASTRANLEEMIKIVKKERGQEIVSKTVVHWAPGEWKAAVEFDISTNIQESPVLPRPPYLF